MMIDSDDRGRVKIVLYGINSKMADVSLTSLLLTAPHMDKLAKVVTFFSTNSSFSLESFVVR